MHWVAQYIGIKWKFSGNNIEEGFDCWGFFRYIQKKHFGITLSKIQIPKNNYMTIIREFQKNSEYSNWKKVKQPNNGDGILLKTSKYPSHIGMYINSSGVEGVLHCIEKIGVVFHTPISLRHSGWKNCGFYRYIYK